MMLKMKFMHQRMLKGSSIQSCPEYRKRMKLKWDYIIKRTIKKRKLIRSDIISIVIHICTFESCIALDTENVAFVTKSEEKNMNVFNDTRC